jgi:hypothetical protein
VSSEVGQLDPSARPIAVGTPRRALTALAAAVTSLALIAPAASAQGFDEQCAENAPSASVCTGSQKLGERGSAECRRVGDGVDANDGAGDRKVGDDRCYPPTGHQVNRAAVSAYKSSWVHRALQFQYSLGNDVPFRDAPWVGTHNSFNSPSEMPTLSHTDSNQQLSLTEQLDIDVRSLELDIHWNPSPRRGGAPAPVVCHARPRGEQNAGCTSERLFDEVLADVAGWLKQHPDQVLLLYLEDAIEDDAGYAEVQQELANQLKRGDQSMIYRPRPAGQAACENLPLGASRQDVLDAGAQVVIVGDCTAGWKSTVFGWKGNTSSETGSSGGYRDYPACAPLDRPGGFSRQTYDTKLVRYFEDSTWIATAIEPTSPPSDEDRLTPEKVRRMTRCGVDLLGMDQLLPDDGRLEALVWSWARDEPRAGAGECAVQRPDGRWVNRPCGGERRAACRLEGGGWSLTSTAVAYEETEAACASDEATFDLPRTGYENSRLRDLAKDEPDGVWLNHRQEGTPETPVEVGSSGSSPRSTTDPRAPGPEPRGSVGSPAHGRRSPTASCKMKRAGGGRRRVVCSIQFGSAAAGSVSARLTKGGRTYARARTVGKRITLIPRRRLRRGTYVVSLRVGGASLRLPIRAR